MPTPGSASVGTSLALISTPTSGWLQGDVCVLRSPPFRLRVSHYLTPTCPSDPPRSPWVIGVSSPPCRPHTPWYAGEEPLRLRLHSADSTILQLGPTGSSPGSLPSITTRWFSAHPSDSTSRWTPCPPKDSRRRLQVHLGCVQLSPSCPFRLLHTFLSPGPRGITPAFGYGAPHPSARGTSTLLNNALLSAHYGPLRLPAGAARGY